VLLTLARCRWINRSRVPLWRVKFRGKNRVGLKEWAWGGARLMVVSLFRYFVPHKRRRRRRLKSIDSATTEWAPRPPGGRRSGIIAWVLGPSQSERRLSQTTILNYLRAAPIHPGGVRTLSTLAVRRATLWQCCGESPLPAFDSAHGHAMRAQKTATKTQMYLQQKRKCKTNRTATCNSRSATSSASVVRRIKTRSKHRAKTPRRKAINYKCLEFFASYRWLFIIV